LAPAIRQLFQAEAIRAEGLPHRLTELGNEFASDVQSVWLRSGGAEGVGSGDMFIEVGLLWTGVPSLKTREKVQQRLNDIQSRCDVLLELHSFTSADLKIADTSELLVFDDAEPVFGPSPADLIRSWKSNPRQSEPGEPRERGPIAHELHDRRSMRVAMAIAEKLTRDPSIVEKARKYLDRRDAIAGDAERVTLSEWRGILDTLSVRQLRAFLVSTSERAARLRQSSPFLGVLSADEREIIYRAKTPRA
jgi:hypothetical protein